MYSCICRSMLCKNLLSILPNDCPRTFAGWYIFSLTKSISQLLYITSPLVHVSCIRAGFDLDDTFFLIIFFRVDCKTFGFSPAAWLVLLLFKTSIKSSVTFGKFVFSPNTSRFREKAWTFLREFLSLTDQTTATSKSQLTSLIILETVNLSTLLWHSTRPLLQGLSGVVVQILIFTFPQNVLNSSWVTKRTCPMFGKSFWCLSLSFLLL